MKKIIKKDDVLMYEDGEIIEPLFSIDEWDAETFKDAKIRGYAPMLAKEITDDNKKIEAFENSTNIIEEKFDGTRGLMYFFSQPCEEDEIGYCRIFSRRISVKTRFFAENTDLLPHLRDIDIPELDGTIIDGELFINNQPFKEVSSTLNCLWDKAVNRQLEKGFITFHAFDILKYKGVDLRNVSLINRKKFLHRVVELVNNKYVEEVPYYRCGTDIDFDLDSFVNRNNIDLDKFYENLEVHKEDYPDLYDYVNKDYPFTAKTFYELIVSTGGEGAIIKSVKGKYKCDKRQGEYLKIKKFFTRECIIMGFTKPTKEYIGKYPKDRWEYWLDKDDVRLSVYKAKNTSAKELLRYGFIPVTKFHYYNLVGDLRVGVIITDEEIENLPKNKQFNIVEIGINSKPYKIVEVGDLQGFDENMRYAFSYTWFDTETETYHVITPEDEKYEEVKNSERWVKYSFKGDVAEIKCNEIFDDTGKMRHPRFMRLRYDKNAEECSWENHLI